MHVSGCTEQEGEYGVSIVSGVGARCLLSVYAQDVAGVRVQVFRCWQVIRSRQVCADDEH